VWIFLFLWQLISTLHGCVTCWKKICSHIYIKVLPSIPFVPCVHWILPTCKFLRDPAIQSINSMCWVNITSIKFFRGPAIDSINIRYLLSIANIFGSDWPQIFNVVAKWPVAKCELAHHIHLFVVTGTKISLGMLKILYWLLLLCGGELSSWSAYSSFHLGTMSDLVKPSKFTFFIVDWCL